MAKGGSRLGAGRPAYKQKAELSFWLDIRALQRGGFLDRRYPFAWVWHTNYGEKVGSATIYVMDDRLHLSYTWQARNVENSLEIAKTACNYGGVRSWFKCPQCSGRCAKVFFNKRNGHYACRLCVGITYYSQCEDSMDRATRKQIKLERKLGEYLMKPKGMYQTTHTRICKQIQSIVRYREYLLYCYAKRANACYLNKFKTSLDLLV